MSLLQVDNLSISYPECADAAVSKLSFDVNKGEAVGVVGESGAGKTQTALAIMGLLPGNARIDGSIRLAGKQVVGARAEVMRKLRSKTVSMVFQDPATALNPYLRVGDQLRRILQEHQDIGHKDARQRSIEMLDRVGLPRPDKQYRAFPHQLSGGMRQRALIAAALIGEPDLIVADEPTTALDVTVQAQILRLLRDLRQDLGTALLMITHDLGVIAQSCERLLVMDAGTLIEEGRCEDVFANPAHEHTARLIAAVPRIDSPPPPVRVSATDAEPVLEVRRLTVSFTDRRRSSSGKFVAVESLDLFVAAGETVAVVGESGSGKTSLARATAGLLRRGDGEVSLLGSPLAPRVESRPKSMRRNLQMVFQDPVSSLDPAMRIGRIIAEPLAVHSRDLSASTLITAVADALARVGLEQDLSERFPHELSGGQAQRVAIARALAIDPKVLICDEALAALDGTVRREILALLKSEQERSNLALIMITHDLGVVREIADRVAVMYRGRVVETASNEQLFSNPQHEYTKSLLAAVPTI